MRGFKDIKFVYDFKAKERNVQDYIRYMLIRTSQMFQYTNLPDTIPANMLEYYLQLNGTVGIISVDEKLYAVPGGWGGEPDAYYRSTKYTVANPALKLSKTYELGKDCVLAYNDSCYKGLRDLYSKYATALVENDLTLNIASIVSRCQYLLSAGDDRSKKEAQAYLDKLVGGDIAVIGNNMVLDSIKTLPFSSQANNTITNLIELQQYLKASWFNELGLHSNYNMKRESINSGEAQLGKDALLPLIDDMLHSRQKWIAEVNALYGTEIQVDFHSSWAHIQEESFDDEEGSENPGSETEDNEEGSENPGSESKGANSGAETKEEIGEEHKINKDREKPDDNKTIEVPVDEKDVEDAKGNGGDVE